MGTLEPPLEAALLRLADHAHELDPYTVAAMEGLLKGYHTRWRYHQLEIELVDVEKTVESPLYNLSSPKRSSKSRTFRLAGKIDKIANENGLTIYDHKTHNGDIQDPAGAYWRQLEIDRQATHYALMLRLGGHDVQRIVWDVIRKPQIRPKKLTATDRSEITEYGTYHGVALDSVDMFDEETPEQFGIRVHELCEKDPEKYFQRRGLDRLSEDLIDHSKDVWEIAQEIKRAQRHGRWYKNTGACMKFGRPCKYLGICSHRDTVDSSHWQRREWAHPELPVLCPDLECLTFSSLRCFLTCRRKYYHSYVLKLERVDAEKPAPLVFGSVFHDALDAWWTVANQLRRKNEQSEKRDFEVPSGAG